MIILLHLKKNHPSDSFFLLAFFSTMWTNMAEVYKSGRVMSRYFMQQFYLHKSTRYKKNIQSVRWAKVSKKDKHTQSPETNKYDNFAGSITSHIA